MIGLWLASSTCSPAATVVKVPSALTPDGEPLIPVTVLRLAIDPANQQPIVTLIDADEKRVFPIWIGLSEARAIHSELQGMEHSRPLTHDLLAGIIEKVDGKIQRVIITHVKDNVFFATLVIIEDGSLIEVDARPSDSIVMALKFNAPIYVAQSLFETMSIPVETPNKIGGTYGLNIQEITPELARYLALDSNKGVMVSGVRPGSRAAKDGLQAGDIMVEIDGRLIADVTTVKYLMANSNEPVKARIMRGEQTLNISLHFE
ncbi:MAG: PDZ domain-containing protein [bacterium]|nr:PDZ domain-containing protein [bacterium]